MIITALFQAFLSARHKAYGVYVARRKVFSIIVIHNVGEIPGTAENLKASAAGENGEWTEMYKRMAAEANAEGFPEIACLFEGVGAIEKEHEERYLKLLKNIEDGAVFAKKEKAVWICRNCGHIEDGKSAPEKCPVCAHPQAYFELRAVNY